MEYPSLTAFILGWLLQTIPIAGVDIEFYPQASCYPGPENQMMARCQSIRENECRNVPQQRHPLAVPGPSACSGTLNDSAGAGETRGVCMMEQGEVVLLGLGGRLDNGGAAWFNMMDIIQKPQQEQRQPAPYIQAPREFANSDFIRGGLSRHENIVAAREDESKRDAADPQPVSRDDWQNLVDNIVEYQSDGNTHYADISGWEENSNSLWVLENPTKEQVEKLGSFAPAETQDAVNEHPKEVGATHYDDYKFDSEGIELEENVNEVKAAREAGNNGNNGSA